VPDQEPSRTTDPGLAEAFEEERPRLVAIASRMLGSPTEADDAVQETWLRLGRSDPSTIENLGGWLTTVLTRVCLNVLRSRSRRDEASFQLTLVDPVVQLDAPVLPEGAAVLADAVESALLVVLDALPPAERVAFVLHDVFALPFDEIAPMLDRSPAATRQLASRGRRRVHGDRPAPVTGGPSGATDPVERRAVVDAFFRAARAGDLAALVRVLDPDVVLRADPGPARGGVALVRGAEAVAGRAAMFADPARATHPAWVGGDPAVVVTVDGRVVTVMRFAVLGDRIVAVDALSDPDRLAVLEVPVGPADRS